MNKSALAFWLSAGLLLTACHSVSEPAHDPLPETVVTTLPPAIVASALETALPEVTTPPEAEAPVTTVAPPKTTEAPAKVTNAPAKVTEPPAPATEPPANDKAVPTVLQGILVANKSYSLPADYNPGVDKTAKAAFELMRTAATKEGLNIYISSSFRSYDYQVKLYDRYVKQHGRASADTFSARPGHSEHQTGLTFDLNTIDDAFGKTAEAAWVASHAHEYGFIIRYPKDKEDVTGYQYEPWHIRYLGVDIATAVYDSGLCLEEYLGITSEYAD